MAGVNRCCSAIPVPPSWKEQLIRALAHSLRGIEDYIFGPDMGTDETCMAWVRDDNG
ncbi:MAG: hypothetical protein R3F37_22475 [Candidatus Competibacteraceae bacterium]